jgi:hypothetical protein
MINKRYEKLLEPYHIGSVKTRNRIIKTAAGTNYWHEDQLHMTMQCLAYHEALAKVETKLTPPAEVRVLADRDGQLEMLTLKQVRQLATQKRLKPVYQVSAKPQVTIDHSKPSVTTREESASFSKPVSLTEGGGSKPSPTGVAKIKLSSDLDVSPAEFVHQLRTEARSGPGLSSWQSAHWRDHNIIFNYRSCHHPCL